MYYNTSTICDGALDVAEEYDAAIPVRLSEYNPGSGRPRQPQRGEVMVMMNPYQELTLSDRHTSSSGRIYEGKIITFHYVSNYSIILITYTPSTLMHVKPSSF